MRVAVNAEQLLYRSPGGIGRYTAQLLMIPPTIFPGDETVAFVARHSRQEVRDAFAAAGVSADDAERTVILPLPRPALYELWMSARWPRLPDFGGVDVVHAPSVAVPPHPRRPLVVTVHDAAADLYPEAFTRWGRRFHRQGMAAAARRADAIITPSEAAADEILANSQIRADRIRVIPHGVVPIEVRGEEAAAVLADKGLIGRPYVLWVGSLEPRKGVGTLVAAMAELRRRGRASDVVTVLAGYEGWLTDDLVDPADRSALGADLLQIGRVSEHELWALYQGATIFAFPSRHEGFGLPVIEAMSQNVAVVASDIAALRETAGDGALLVAPGDVGGWAASIESLLVDERLRADVAGRGLARSREFTVGRSLSALRTIYTELGAR